MELHALQTPLVKSLALKVLQPLLSLRLGPLWPLAPLKKSSYNQGLHLLFPGFLLPLFLSSLCSILSCSLSLCFFPSFAQTWLSSFFLLVNTCCLILFLVNTNPPVAFTWLFCYANNSSTELLYCACGTLALPQT